LPQCWLGETCACQLMTKTMCVHAGRYQELCGQPEATPSNSPGELPVIVTREPSTASRSAGGACMLTRCIRELWLFSIARRDCLVLAALAAAAAVAAAAVLLLNAAEAAACCWPHRSATHTFLVHHSITHCVAIGLPPSLPVLAQHPAWCRSPPAAAPR
jgi:hypothetical protein